MIWGIEAKASRWNLYCSAGGDPTKHQRNVSVRRSTYTVHLTHPLQWYKWVFPVPHKMTCAGGDRIRCPLFNLLHGVSDDVNLVIHRGSEPDRTAEARIRNIIKREIFNTHFVSLERVRSTAHVARTTFEGKRDFDRGCMLKEPDDSEGVGV